MAVTYGFYNSINKDRAYNAIQISQMFDGIINDGIYDQFEDHLEVREGTGMTVIVKPGRAWLNHTWTYNDSDLVLQVEGSDFQANRIDAVVLKVDHTDNGRINTIYVQKGSVSEHPQRPIFENTDTVFYYPLAFIFVDAQTESIPQSKIENNIGANNIPPEGDEYGPYIPPIPFVTGIIDHVTAGDLLRQWVAEWDEYKVYKRNEYDEWVVSMEQDMIGWTTEQKRAFLSWINNSESDFDAWSSERKAMFDSWRADRNEEFNEWFDNISYVLDGDAAGHLQVEIDEINEREFKHFYEICNKNIKFYRDADTQEINRITSDDGENANQVIEIQHDEEHGTDVIINTITHGPTTYTKRVFITGDNITCTYTKNI